MNNIIHVFLVAIEMNISYSKDEVHTYEEGEGETENNKKEYNTASPYNQGL